MKVIDLRSNKVMEKHVLFNDNCNVFGKSGIYRGYKIVLDDGSPAYSACSGAYTIGGIFESKKRVDLNHMNICSSGLHVGTLEWCRNSIKHDINSDQIAIVAVEFRIPQKHVIPVFSSGKFRISRFTVVGQLSTRSFRVLKRPTLEIASNKRKVFKI